MHSEFAVHIPDSQAIEMAQAIAKRFDNLLTELETFCRPGRELALAKTKLEEACFFAQKARRIASTPLGSGTINGPVNLGGALATNTLRM